LINNVFGGSKHFCYCIRRQKNIHHHQICICHNVAILQHRMLHMQKFLSYNNLRLAILIHCSVVHVHIWVLHKSTFYVHSIILEGMKLDMSCIPAWVWDKCIICLSVSDRLKKIILSSNTTGFVQIFYTHIYQSFISIMRNLQKWALQSCIDLMIKSIISQTMIVCNDYFSSDMFTNGVFFFVWYVT